MKPTSCLIPVMLSTLILGACTRKVYVEKPTPAGEVPMAPASTIAPLDDGGGRPDGDGTEPPPPARTGRPEAADPPPRKTGAAASLDDRFRSVYRGKGRPRMAVFLNRTLSDQVREWATPERFVQSNSRRTRSLYRQHHRSLAGGRMNPAELWMWEFEDGFMSPLLSAGIRLVDRAPIMRLASAHSGLQGSAGNPLAVRKVEMDALVNHADLFVELLVEKSTAARHGYAFKATVKEVKTGVIVANITSLAVTAPIRETSEDVVEATDRGYVIDTRTIREVPSLHETATDMARRLMVQLLRTWS